MGSICLVELPAIKLIDRNGRNWTALRQHEPKRSAQILVAQLRHLGHDVTYENVKRQSDETEVGRVRWCGQDLAKVAVGRPWTELRGSDFDIWGLTVNFMQEREFGCEIVRHLTDTGGRVIVGGSDVIAVPGPYFEAGAVAVVTDKSGKVNKECIDFVLGTAGKKSMPLASGTIFNRRGPALSPEDWPLPDLGIARQALGTDYWEAPLADNLKPLAGLMFDVGCDRKCDFCQTPTYKLGYKSMSAGRAKQWLDIQKEAGAKSVGVLSDQFLGRILWDGGRESIMEITGHARELGLALLYGNGLEIKKATLGRSFPNSDPTPDMELIEAVWGWDGERGTAQAYIPAERPTLGPDAYPKLLQWKEHVAMLKAIVSAGLPDITYGVIVGFKEDSHESLTRLLEACLEMKSILRDINPELRFRLVPYAIRPIPGTPQAAYIQNSGLLVYDDPTIQGGFWTPCARTDHLSVEEVGEWQEKLVGTVNDPEPKWQGITRFSITDELPAPGLQGSTRFTEPADKPYEFTSSRKEARVRLETMIAGTAGDELYAGYLEDLSEHGLFVATDEPAAVGTTVTVRMTLEGGEILCAEGVVRWTRRYAVSKDDSTETNPGMGIEFTTVDDKTRMALEKFVSAHLDAGSD